VARPKAKPESPFAGRWHIASMTEGDEDFINAEVQGFIEFDDKNSGSFQFGYVSGDMDCRLTTRDGVPAVEWTWDGNDEMDHAEGRGWAVLKGDELHGMMFFHEVMSRGLWRRRPRVRKAPRGRNHGTPKRYR
jgi:hypothetical protein